ncbi:TonB-dependent receptor [Janthinobacterium agaricidamnosum]|nr:TonB-dependent receptor [Janthinobacterium agaricidamnosum]
MIVSAFRLHRLPPRRALAGLLAACFAAGLAPSVLAQNVQAVMVSGARLSKAASRAPIGATVIDSEQISQYGARDVADALRKIGGIGMVSAMESLTGPGSGLKLSRSAVGADLLGLQDGVRILDNVRGQALLSTVPIENVERIEVSRGGNSVQYGAAGGSGAVVNLVSKTPPAQALHGSLYGEVGQFGQRDTRASVVQNWDGFSMDAALQDSRSSDYRDHSQFREVSFSGGAEWKSKQGRAGFSVDATRQDSRFPFPTDLSQPDDGKPGAATPGDFGSFDTNRISGFVQRYIGNFDLGLELTQSEKNVSATHVRDGGDDDQGSAYAGYSYDSSYSSRETQLSPRLRHGAKVDGVAYDTEIGIDLIRWRHQTGNALFRFDRKQSSSALFVREDIGFGGPRDVRLSFGARHEKFNMNDIASSDFVSIGDSGARDWQHQNAWDVQASFKPAPWASVYAKASQSYRIDDSGFTTQGYRPLIGQVSHDQEAGATFGGDARNASVRLFSHRLHNEIVFDQNLGQAGTGRNLDPNQRQGIELEANWRLAPAWSLNGQLRHVNARYDDYPYDGPDLPLVARNTVSARLSWLPASGHSADLGVQWMDVQRYGNDFDQSCLARTPSFALLDGRYARKIGAWELALSASNLANKRYYSNAPECLSSIYANDARQVRVSARYSF